MKKKLKKSHKILQFLLTVFYIKYILVFTVATHDCDIALFFDIIGKERNRTSKVLDKIMRFNTLVLF